MCLIGIVNKPEDVGIEGADTVANAAIRKEKGMPYLERITNAKYCGCKILTICIYAPLSCNLGFCFMNNIFMYIILVIDLLRHHINCWFSDRKPGQSKGTWSDLFSSSFFWSLGLVHLVIMAVRIAALDWGQMYLIQDLGMPVIKGLSSF